MKTLRLLQVILFIVGLILVANGFSNGNTINIGLGVLAFIVVAMLKLARFITGD